MLRRRFLQESVPFDMSNYMTIEPLADGFYFKCADTNVEYTTDGKKWTKLNAGTSSETFTSGQFISVRSKLQPGNLFGRFYLLGAQCNLRGNCLSLIFGDYAKGKLDISQYPKVFADIFLAQSTIISVEKNFLPALILGDYCYAEMFRECRNLTSVPDLPATTLAINCYAAMFQQCIKLTTAQTILPAMNLVDNCYAQMFIKCIKLTTAPVLPAISLPSYTCYDQMFANCSKLSYLEIHATTYFGTSLSVMQMLINAGASATSKVIYMHGRGNANVIRTLNTSWTIHSKKIIPSYITINPNSSIEAPYLCDTNSDSSIPWGNWIMDTKYNPGHFYLDDDGCVRSTILGKLYIGTTPVVAGLPFLASTVYTTEYVIA